MHLSLPLGIWTGKKIMISIQHAIGDENTRKELVFDLYSELFRGFLCPDMNSWAVRI